MDRELDLRFAILSPTVRQLLSGDAIPTLADTLAKQHGLDEGMKDGVENEIALILMYLEPVDDFATTLMSEYLVPPESALEIEKEVTARLFTPIMHELGKSAELEDVTAPTPSVLVPNLSSNPPAVSVGVPISPVSNPTQPPPTPIPQVRVMPKNEAELLSSLLHNLKASLAHGTEEEPYVEQPTPKASYNSLLDTKPPTSPIPPQQ